MKKVFFALILSFLGVNFCFASDELKEYEDKCKNLIDSPKVRVFSSYGKLQYDFAKSNKFLKKETEKKFNQYNKELYEDFYPVGLTKVKDVFEFNMNVGEIDISKDYKCIYPVSIDVYLGYEYPTIYISNDLEKDSCMYNVALRHENTHMQIYIEALDNFLGKLKFLAMGLYGNIGVEVIDKKYASKEAAEKYNKLYYNSY